MQTQPFTSARAKCDVNANEPWLTGSRAFTLLTLCLALASGCAQYPKSGGILNLSPPASFPECTYYGYYPTCWGNWRPGWNCCPLPCDAEKAEYELYEALPPAEGNALGQVPSSAANANAVTPASSESAVRQVGYVAPFTDATNTGTLGQPAPGMLTSDLITVTRLPACE